MAHLIPSLDWFTVTSEVCDLVGLRSTDSPGGEAKFHAWMRKEGWRPVGQAAGNVHWTRGAEHIWLTDSVSYAIAEIITGIRGGLEDLLPQHGILDGADTRRALDLLAAIEAMDVTAEDRESSARWDGGGLLVLRT